MRVRAGLTIGKEKTIVTLCEAGYYWIVPSGQLLSVQ